MDNREDRKEFQQSKGGEREVFTVVKDDAVSAALNMPANLEHSARATGLEKVSFYSNPKERKCQRMFKLPHSFHTLAR